MASRIEATEPLHSFSDVDEITTAGPATLAPAAAGSAESRTITAEYIGIGVVSISCGRANVCVVAAFAVTP